MRFSTFLLKNLLRRKTRSLLTIFGVAIAVLTTVALLGISDAFQRSAIDGLERRGVDLIALEEGAIDQLSSELDESLLDKVRAIPGVLDAAGALAGLAAFDTETSTVTAMVQGWDPQSYLFDVLEITAGHKFQSADERSVLLGGQLAQNLNKQCGDQLQIEGEPFEVVGIFRSIVPAENSQAIVPLLAYQKVRYQEGRITGFSTQIEKRGDVAMVERVREAIQAVSADSPQTPQLIVYKTEEYANESSYLQMARAMTWLTSLIAVTVGAVGVLNTMVMSVVERIREISILRAIGWRRRRVVQMILGESVLLSLIGAAIGASLAFLLTRVLMTTPAANGIVQQDIPPRILAIGVLLALAVGLVGGLYPSWLASRLLPSEGLRHE
ncbi:MAG: ABC transporter permease [Planctomycetales bacterium]|nr:ABC transporter permease [Planctomycetales bacterium]